MVLIIITFCYHKPKDIYRSRFIVYRLPYVGFWIFLLFIVYRLSQVGETIIVLSLSQVEIKVIAETTANKYVALV